MFRFKFFNAIFLLVAISVFAVGDLYAYGKFNQAQIKTLIPSETRTVISLAGNWEKECDGVAQDQVSIPYSESSIKTVSYTKTIKIEKRLAESLVWNLYFPGINLQAEIYFNDQFVGRYFGGLAPVNVKISEKMINGGDNVIKLVVFPAEAASGQIRTQYVNSKRNYIGIVREAFLIGTPAAWVSDIKYDLSFNNNYTSSLVKAHVSISTGKLANLAKMLKDSVSSSFGNKAEFFIEAVLVKKGTRETAASSEAKRIILESDRTIVHNFDLNVSNPALWTPQTPELYELRLKITRNGSLIDDYTCDLGFKDVKVSTLAGQTRILLNGLPFQIKGACYVEDHQETGQSLSPFRMEEDIQLMKTLGANTVRFMYNSPHPYLLALCDKYGMLATIELPLYSAPAGILKSDEIKVQMKNLAKQYIAFYDNHVSLFAYGVADQLQENDFVSGIISDFCLNSFKPNTKKLLFKVVPFGVKKLATDGFDFIGINVPSNIINKEVIKSEVTRLKSLINGLPFYLTFGASVQPNNHNGYSDPLSLERQAFLIRTNFYASNETGACGVIVQSFNDFALNSPHLNANNPDLYVCYKGLFDRNRGQRLAFQTLQALFNEEKEPLLNAGSYSERTPITFIIFGIGLLGSFIFLLNRFRRFREYFFRSFLRPFNFYSDIRDQRIMSSVQTVLLGLLVSFSIGLFVSSMLFLFRSSEVAQYFFMTVAPVNFIQEILFRMVWMPELMCLILSVLTFLLIFLIATVIKVFAFFLRARVYYTDALTMTIWAGIPFLILLPLSIVLIRLLVAAPAGGILFIILFIIIGIWSIERILKCSSVVFDVQANRSYIFGALLLIITAGIPISILHFKYSALAYMQYFSDVIMKI